MTQAKALMIVEVELQLEVIMIIFLLLKTNWLILCDHALENLASQACEDRVLGKWARKLGWWLHFFDPRY